ncbi:hypothetical protein CR513_46273, partial [Mucuna pruriens]
MYINGGNYRLSCKLFPGTLRGVAMQWMATLPPRSIQTFKDLASSFVSQFATNKVKKLEVADLFDIRQIEGGSLKSYLAPFNNATVRVEDPDQKFFVKAFQKGLRVGPFSDALALRKPVNMEEIRAQAKKHVEMEEDQFERWKSERGPNHRHLAKAKEDKCPMLNRTNEHTQNFTPLTEKRTQILREICHTTLLEFPQGTKGKVMGNDKDGWCNFHQTFGHITEDCWVLKMQIEKLVQAGHLNRYIRRSSNEQCKSRGSSRGRSANTKNPPHRGTIATISRGKMTTFLPNHKQEVRRTEEERRVERVQVVLTRANMTPLGRKEPTPTITFDDRDLKRGTFGRDESMVISVMATEYKIEHVLIDQGSSANILYWSTVQKMQLSIGWL